MSMLCPLPCIFFLSVPPQPQLNTGTRLTHQITDKSRSIEPHSQKEPPCNILTFTVQNLQSHGSAAPEWRRADKAAETQRLSGSLSPAKKL